ncbi:helix-turn-helix domain-containing protein [Flavobacteriaceae bacterium TP-CH-4]|uniref:Helix-turn-helix domain-containing protein n=1 Tax=Pelagihabitans pacificus TaxID=2696054 RepID=A0A967AUN8_9FLAO|nr:helix-turn-helix domain-containing protein [Pelagihabitans pacificus]NHF60711.1 helix-turn-helix domain-containing protein [Pelagihabitans pacificus]
MKTVEVLLVVLLAIGALQGLVYGFILWNNKGPNKTANRFLAAILFFFSYRLLVETLKIFGLGRYDFWYHTLLEYNWVYGALIYFFVKSYVRPTFKLGRKDWIHFLPVGIEFAWSNFIKTQNFYWDGTRESLSWLGYWGYVVWMLYPTMYVVAGSLIIYYTYRAQFLLKNEAGPENIEIIPGKTRWLYRVLLTLRIFSVIYVVVILIDFFFFNFASNFFYAHPVFIGMAIITYWLGIEGFNRRNEIIVKVRQPLSGKEKVQMEEIAQSLEKAMRRDQLFRDPDLSLTKLSKQLEVKSYLITKCLNLHFGKKFNDYVNDFRIEALKELLKDPTNDDYTLLGLAFDVGFNSKASFNRAVKKSTGQSPTQLKSTL